MERYGDYNEIDESPVKRKSPILFMIKFTAIFITLVVVGIIALRVILFNYYPSDLTRIYVDDKLISAFNANGGKLDAVKQDLRFGYDDPDLGNFMCEEVLVVRDIGRVQVTVRLNTSAYANIAEKYKVEASQITDETKLSFKLFRNNVKNSTNNTASDRDGEYTFYYGDVVGEVERVDTDSLLMYRYFRVVIDGVDFNGVNDDDVAEWLSLAIYVDGYGDGTPYSRLLIYENNETYSSFDKLEIDEGDLKK